MVVLIPVGRWWLATLTAALCVVVPLRAQQALCVDYKDKTYPVQKVHNGWVTIQVDGKPVAFIAKYSTLQEVGEYLPVLVAVKEVEARSTGQITWQGANFNNYFLFNAEFTSPTALSEVFFVLELKSESVGKRIFFQEVGELPAGTPCAIAATVPSQERLGRGNYRLHIFSRGQEVFNSRQPAGYREAMLERMVGKRIAGVTQGNPRPFYAPPPVDQKVLPATASKGEAVIRLTIRPTGAVLDPAVESASDPAFGQAALAAVRQWYFLPKVENGRAVECKVSLPVAFDPPKTPAGRN